MIPNRFYRVKRTHNACADYDYDFCVGYCVKVIDDFQATVVWVRDCSEHVADTKVNRVSPRTLANDYVELRPQRRKVKS